MAIHPGMLGCRQHSAPGPFRVLLGVRKGGGWFPTGREETGDGTLPGIRAWEFVPW